MLIQADARALPLQDGCVQCVVSSPPYYALRNYGVEGQIGLEPSADFYVDALVAVFTEVRRVLKDDGVLWLNLGDSYSGVGAQTGGTKSKEHGKRAERMFKQVISWRGQKAKDLMGIPWRVAFALQADGWYLRSDVIWSKPNPMPESVTDRPTKAHEYLFLLTKSERYYYDAAAIAEPVSEAMRYETAMGYDGEATKDYAAAGVQDPSSVKARIIANARKKQDGHGRRYEGFNDRWDETVRLRAIERFDRGEIGSPSQMSAVVSETGDRYMSGRVRAKHQAEHGQPMTRNRRTVWTIPTRPYTGAHFATMPEKLVEPCILAGSRLGDLVFDPFSGSGTVLAVAERLGRRGVGTDLNPAYHALAKQRTAQRGLRWTDASAAQAEPEHP